MKSDRVSIAKTTLKYIMNVFRGIGFFMATFSPKVKNDTKPYQAASRHVAYTLQEPFQKELERLQKYWKQKRWFNS